jgi:hypothetical protein
MRACLVVMVIGGCSHPASTTQPAPPVPVVEPTPVPPTLRLPAGVARPTREEVDLVIDPASEGFTGHVTIEVDVLLPTKVLWLNANELAVDEATVTAGGRRIAATPVTGKDYLGLRFASEQGDDRDPVSRQVTSRRRGRAVHAEGGG